MDPIADMLTIIRNSLLVKKYDVTVSSAKVKWHILKKLENLGLVQTVVRDTEKNVISFQVITEDGASKFSTLKRLSKPGRRWYVGSKEIPRPSGNGVILISTSQGILSGYEARQRHLGGELICEIS